MLGEMKLMFCFSGKTLINKDHFNIKKGELLIKIKLSIYDHGQNIPFCNSCNKNNNLTVAWNFLAQKTKD